MALPLPKVIPDTGPGGPFVTAMGGVNALHDAMLKTKMQEIENQYAPLTKQSEAASKLTYANLMGPQFLAKLMGHDSILANLSDPQKEAALKMMYGAGTGQGSATNVFSQMQQRPAQQPLGRQLLNKLMGIFDGGGKQPQQQSPQGQPAINYDTPQGVSQIPISQANALLNQPSQMPSSNAIQRVDQPNYQPTVYGQPRPGKTYAEKTGEYKGIVKEGEALGGIRAKDIQAMDDMYFNAQNAQATLNNLTDIASSPEFEQIRQVPLAGRHELAYYSKFGTPEQQNMVGQYYTLAGNIVKDASRDFAGAFRKGEQQLLQGMKPNESDTVNTARGKIEALSVMNSLLAERSRLVSQIMSEQHISKSKALDLADKQIDGEQIRNQIHDKLNPMVTIVNSKGERRTVTVAEARKLGVPNV